MVSRKRRRADTGRGHWSRWPEKRLLDTRLCDLDVALEGTPIEPAIDQLYDELGAKGLELRPHFWLSNEWFSPEGVPGVAIPFYLTHPRLTRMERRHALEVEGATRRDCMKLLRHETGHAMQHAFRLHLRRRCQRVFGKSSDPYPDFYRPNPASKRFVINLDFWYAQSHPDEDFAETFAVWLAPRSQWRKRYAGWPAMRKLELMDELMRELRHRRPLVRSRARPDSLRSMRHTLREHYRQKREHYQFDDAADFDPDLKKLFTNGPSRSGIPAATFMRRQRRQIREQVVRWTNDSTYAFDAVYGDMVKRCRALHLRAVGPERRLKTDLAILLAARAVWYLYRSREWHAV